MRSEGIHTQVSLMCVRKSIDVTLESTCEAMHGALLVRLIPALSARQAQAGQLTVPKGAGQASL